MAIPLWKLNLTPASFRGAQFHVEQGERSGGRRDLVHEFPKRDIPYSEDLGRRALRFTVRGYIVGPTYTFDRDALISALEQEGPGTLILPTSAAQQVEVDHYAVIERRERGGMCEFEMTFTEAGQAISISFGTNTASNVGSAADSAAAQFQTSLDMGLKDAS
jgi:prophage DNA circulation protein